MPITHLTRAAKSARGKLALTLLSALTVLGVTGAVLLGAPASTKFELSASPASQTVTAGQSATYAVTLKRGNKFTSPVALSVTGLPSGATGTFAPNPIPGSGTTSSLAVQTSASTPAGSYPLTLRGTSGSSTVTKNVTLVVLASTAANFTLTATPSSRVISEDDEVDYSLDISRTGGYTGPVTLAVSGLPNGISGSYYPNPVTGDDATLELGSSKPKPGVYTVTVTGAGVINGSQVNRATAIQLVVEEKKAFQIEGDPTQGLVPGVAVPLDLQLTNPHNFPLQVTEVAVSVGQQTSNAGCGGAANYSIDPMTGVYPLTLPANSTRSLSDLGVADQDKPAATMNDLANTSQDACKGATVFFNYSGAATK